MVMKRLLNMERVTFQGEYMHVNDIELDVVHGKRETCNVPIMIRATCDQMMELAGEIADGAILNYCFPKVQEYINHGTTCPILYPAGSSLRLLIDTFAN